MRLKLGGKHSTTLCQFENGQAVLESAATKERKSVTEGALLQAIFDGKVVIEDREPAPSADAPAALARLQERGATAKAIEHGTALLQYVTALRQRGVSIIRDVPWIRAEINSLAKGELSHLPRFALTTLYEADLKLRTHGEDVSVLVPNYAGRGGRGHMRLDSQIVEMLRDELYKRLAEKIARPFSSQELFNSINNRITTHNLAADRADKPLPPISESSVRRYVKREVPSYVRLELRVGSKKAQKIFRSHSGARDTAAHPLEVSEYDDIDTAVFLIDDRNGLPWGRAYLTNGLCQNTLTVLGYDVGTKPRSYESAIGAICDSLVPKADVLPGEMGYGVQGIMLVDNARYNTGQAMKHRCEAEGLLFARARPFGSTEKSAIEHYNHIVKSDFCPTLPGWRGDKNNRDAVVKGMSSAILTVEQFAKAYRHWLTKIYANMPGDDGMTARQRWLKFFARHSPAVRYTPLQLEMLRLRPLPLKFRESGGLERLKLRYDCTELERLRKKLGATAGVIAFVPPKLTYLKVLNPFTNAYIHVPCTEDHHYVRTTTAAQHKLVLKLQRTRKKTNPDIADMAEGRQLLAQMVMEASKSNKLRTRHWAMQVGDPAQTPEESGDAPAQPAAGKQPASTKEKYHVRVCTVVEDEVAQLDEVELDEEEEWA